MATINTVLITGGGTGGHIFPAIAIANELKNRFPSISIHFVGGLTGMETALVPKAGYPFHGLNISGIYRQLTLKNLVRNLGVPYKTLQTYWAAKALLKQFKPDLVVGTGGYASFPLVFAAQRADIPTFLNEQNAYPGLVNRMLGKRAKKVLLGNPDAQADLPGANCVFTGNPIREQLRSGNRNNGIIRFDLDPHQPVILLSGGSLGARTLNQAFTAELKMLREAGVQVLWQCGSLYYGNLKAAVAGYDNIRLHPFIDDMADAYAVADLVVCRAGALTISELVELRKPALIVPSPNVAADHQTRNAMSLVAKGAAHTMPDEMAVKNLVPTAIKLLKDEAAIERLRNNMALLPQTNAAKAIVNEILDSLG